MDESTFNSILWSEIHAIVGGNGCGKSTLAKTMSGVLPVDKGKVSILGQTPTSPVMARNMGIATVFQEVMIAMSIANNPDLLIADEPTTALDVTVQLQILELLKKIQEKR